MHPEIILLSVLVLILACFSAYLIIKVPTRYSLKFLLIPLVTIIGLMLVVQIPNIMGMPIQGYPEKKFEYIGHNITKDGKGKLSIQLWAGYGKDNTKLYQFDFDADTAAKLQGMQKLRMGQGRPSFGKFKNGEGKGKKGSTKGVRDGQEKMGLEVEVPDVKELLPPKDNQAAPQQDE